VNHGGTTLPGRNSFKQQKETVGVGEFGQREGKQDSESNGGVRGEKPKQQDNKSGENPGKERKFSPKVGTIRKSKEG